MPQPPHHLLHGAHLDVGRSAPHRHMLDATAARLQGHGVKMLE